ncbi:MAG: hypothetical protein E7032_08445 [Akkermansiaceae bacterium]|nr:hypothetical protein [Akkermansiaceae bacterium]
MMRCSSWLSLICMAALLGPLVAQQSAPAESAGETVAGEPESEATVAVLRYGAFAAAEGGNGVTAATFAAQMNYLKEQGLTPISLQQFIDWKQGRTNLPERSVLITLDEADMAAFTVAFPILEQFGFPYVVFADGRSFQKSETALNAGQLQEMQLAGAAVGSHSATRPLAHDWKYAEQAGPDAAQKMAERELGLQAQRITSSFGSCEAFSYPRGYANAHIVENLAVYGYKVAFGLREGKVQKHHPSFMLNRYMVKDMPSFAKAVNFGPPADDSRILQQVRESAARELPISQPLEVEAPGSASAAVYAQNLAAHAAEQPPLPPVVDPVTGQTNGSEPVCVAPIPEPEIEQAELPEVVDPVLSPRPVSTKPAAGTWVRRSPEEDWVSREFPQPVVPREQTRVAVLGYHNFSNTRPVSDMLMRTSEFCQQMQYIQDAGLTVITMQDFQEWLLGERCLPERCVLITIDDGWRSVYTDAYPVLKAYGYPFTLFLYTSYLSGRGQSMTPEMIREMMEHGATIGSHSTTHLYPSQWKRFAEDSPEYAAQLKQELPDSVDKLKSLFGRCSTYCYPGGYHTEPMRQALKAHGVSVAFTVLERKVTTLEDPLQVHRYMVFGTDPRIFRRAVNFDDVPGIKPTAQGITEARERAKAFFPQAFESVVQPAAPVPAAVPATGPLPAPVEPPAPKAELEEIPAPVYTNPAA